MKNHHRFHCLNPHRLSLIAMSFLLTLPLQGSGSGTLNIHYSEDLVTWTPLPVTADMLTPEGGIRVDGLPNTVFFRLDVSDFAASPAPTGMVRVEGGSLSTSNNALNGTAVVTFYMGIYEVTWGEWQTVRTYAAANGYDIGGVGAGCAADHPVRSVSWFDVLKWSNAKSEMEGLTPVYTVSDAVYKTGEPTHTSISQNLTADGFRLPLEAEWEFAARGGNQTNGHTYAGSNDDLNAVGWYNENSGGAACPLTSDRGTWPVGQKVANELGLYDMSGNVWEWCWDRFGDTSSNRHFRGGSWGGFASFCTVSNRFNGIPDFRTDNGGFRLARSSGQ